MENLIGFESTFLSVDELADRLSAAGFDARDLDRGFDCTVAGVKPGAP